MQNSVWLLLIPIFWSAYAYASLKIERGFVASKFAIPFGIALTTFIFATYAFAIVGALLKRRAEKPQDKPANICRIFHQS